MAKPTANTARAIAIGSDSDIGTSRQRFYEDRLEAQTITTAGGQTMTLAVVADGIGGENAGERAAQMTADGILRYCQVATEANIPRMLKAALEKANAEVYAEAQRDRHKHNMGTTAAVAVIQENCLYVANVGDSRVYLVRGKTIRQLTVDHNWAYEMVQAGKLRREEANRHPRRNEPTRFVGYQPTVKVDIGLHLNGGDESDDAALAAQGLGLGPGDRVIVCSDGLIKTRPDGPGRFVEPGEIPALVAGLPAEAAARKLVRIAVERQTDDNVSVIVLEVPGGRRALRLPKPFLIGGAGVLALAFLGLLILPRLLGPVKPTPLPAVPTAIAQGQVLVLNAVGALEGQRPGESFVRVAEGDTVGFGRGQLLRTGTRDGTWARLGLIDQAEVYLAADAEIELREAAPDRIRLTLTRGRVLVHLPEGSGRWLEVAAPTGAVAGVRGSTLGALFDPATDELYVDCLAGECRVGREGDAAPVPVGSHAVVDLGLRVRQEAGTRAELWQFAGGLVDPPTATATLEPGVTPPTETATATQRPVRESPTPPPPTFTPPEPTATPMPGDTPGSISAPSPQPTATSTDDFVCTCDPTSGHIRLPTWTDTPEPPPPTDTPEPTATDTPTREPTPTDTPTPEPTATDRHPVANGIGYAIRTRSLEAPCPFHPNPLKSELTSKSALCRPRRPRPIA